MNQSPCFSHILTRFNQKWDIINWTAPKPVASPVYQDLDAFIITFIYSNKYHIWCLSVFHGSLLPLYLVPMSQPLGGPHPLWVRMPPLFACLECSSWQEELEWRIPNPLSSFTLVASQSSPLVLLKQHSYGPENSIIHYPVQYVTILSPKT